MNRIVFFAGPAGAGKTSTARAWCASRRRAVYLESEAFWHRIVAGKADLLGTGGDQARQYAAAAAACCAAARSYVAAGFDVAIHDAGGPDDFERHWRHRLGPLGCEVVVLLPSLEETLARGAARTKDVPADMVRRQHAASQRWPAERRIDTTAMDLEAATAAVVALLGDPPTFPRARRRLEGGGVVLRAWEETDLDWVHRACQDPDIVRWTNIPWPYQEGDARALLELSERGRRMGTAAAFAITSNDGELLGSAALTFGADRIAEVGYWMAAEARGRGAAPAAVERLAVWATDDLGVARVELKTMVGNRPSERVAEKAGFEREGVLKGAQTGRDGDRVDLVMWSRTAPPAPALAPGPAGTTPPAPA